MKKKPRIRYEPQSIRGPAVLRIVFLFISVAAAFVLHVWLRTQVVAESYRLGEIRSKILELDAEKVKLRLKRERLKNPERLSGVVKRYRERGVDFRHPSPDQVLYYEPLTTKPRSSEELQGPAR